MCRFLLDVRLLWGRAAARASDGDLPLEPQIGGVHRLKGGGHHLARTRRAAASVAIEVGELLVELGGFLLGVRLLGGRAAALPRHLLHVGGVHRAKGGGRHLPLSNAWVSCLFVPVGKIPCPTNSCTD